MRYEPKPERELFNTADAFDAGTVGHDGPITASEGGLSINMSVDARTGCWFRLNGPDGEIVLSAQDAQVVSDTLAAAMRKAAPAGRIAA